MRINRRKLLKVTCMALSTSLPPCLSSAASACQNLGSQPLALFDKNYALAYKLIKQVSSESSNLLPISSDVTDLWLNELKQKSQTEALEISGVSTESAFFCLQQLLERKCLTNFEKIRVNKDLFIWKIYSDPRKNNWSQVI